MKCRSIRGLVVVVGLCSGSIGWIIVGESSWEGEETCAILQSTEHSMGYLIYRWLDEWVGGGVCTRTGRNFASSSANDSCECDALCAQGDNDELRLLLLISIPLLFSLWLVRPFLTFRVDGGAAAQSVSRPETMDLFHPLNWWLCVCNRQRLVFSPFRPSSSSPSM